MDKCDLKRKKNKQKTSGLKVLFIWTWTYQTKRTKWKKKNGVHFSLSMFSFISNNGEFVFVSG